MLSPPSPPKKNLLHIDITSLKCFVLTVYKKCLAVNEIVLASKLNKSYVKENFNIYFLESEKIINKLNK